jgi:hypothetical protein
MIELNLYPPSRPVRPVRGTLYLHNLMGIPVDKRSLQSKSAPTTFVKGNSRFVLQLNVVRN